MGWIRMTVLPKPTAALLADPQAMLTMMVKFWQVLSALQDVNSTIINLGSMQADPPTPPVGSVYEYTLKGSLKVRTATAIYTVAP